MKDAVNCFRLGFFRLALTSIFFVLATVYRKSSTVLATAYLLATNTFGGATYVVLAFGTAFAEPLTLAGG